MTDLKDKTFALKFDAKTRKELRMLASIQGVSMGDYLITLIHEDFQRFTKIFEMEFIKN